MKLAARLLWSLVVVVVVVLDVVVMVALESSWWWHWRPQRSDVGVVIGGVVAGDVGVRIVEFDVLLFPNVGIYVVCHPQFRVGLGVW